MRTILRTILRWGGAPAVAFMLAGSAASCVSAESTTVVAAPSAPPAPPPAAKPAPKPAATNQPAPATTNPVPTVAAAPPVTNTNGVPPAERSLPRAKVPLPPLASEVVAMAEAGVEEPVLLAYIEKSSAAFSLTVDEILYLNDLGLPPAVVTALVKKGGQKAEQALAEATQPAIPNAPLAAPAPTVPPAPTLGAVENPPVPTLAPNSVTPIVTDAPPPPEAAPATVVSQPVVNNYYVFQESLSPYGSWHEVAPYGWCWQPTVAVLDVSWRPYCHRGRWLWTDAGWYWQSDYSWGWAPFHYGRWHFAPRRGWVWVPDSYWGPAWVSWRYTDSYCGWAPLPPEAVYTVGVGFTFRHGHVGVGFDFGLVPDRYVFVGYDRFHDRYPFRHCVPPGRVPGIFHSSHVVNNYRSHDRHVINEGIGHARIASISRQEIHKVALHDVNPVGTRGVRPDRLTADGRGVTVYRPAVPARAPAPNPAGPTAAPARPRPAEQRAVWSAAPTRENINVPLRARTSGGAPAQPSPATRSEPIRRETVTAPAAPLENRSPRATPSAPAPTLEPRANRWPTVASSPAPTPSVSAPNRVTPTPATPGLSPRPSTSSRPVANNPSERERGRQPTPPVVANPVPTAPAPAAGVNPGSVGTPRRVEPRVPQPTTTPGYVGRQPSPRQEAPKTEVNRITPTPNYGANNGAAPAQSAPAVRQEPRGGNGNQPAFRQPPAVQTPPSAPAPSAPPPSRQGQQPNNPGNERGRRSEPRS